MNWEGVNEFVAVYEGIWALYPQNRLLSPKARLLVDYLKKELDGYK